MYLKQRRDCQRKVGSLCLLSLGAGLYYVWSGPLPQFFLAPSPDRRNHLLRRAKKCRILTLERWSCGSPVIRSEDPESERPQAQRLQRSLLDTILLKCLGGLFAFLPQYQKDRFVPWTAATNPLSGPIQSYRSPHRSTCCAASLRPSQLVTLVNAPRKEAIAQQSAPAKTTGGGSWVSHRRWLCSMSWSSTIGSAGCRRPFSSPSWNTRVPTMSSVSLTPLHSAPMESLKLNLPSCTAPFRQCRRNCQIGASSSYCSSVLALAIMSRLPAVGYLLPACGI